MSMLPLVSIIIPCGGSHHKYVGVAVASCLWQTYSHIEVVVVDDGPVELPKYADPRVITIKSPNYGKQKPIGNRPAVARNAGIAKATGDFVVFLDADDYLLPQAIELLIRGHASHDQAYTFSSHYAGERHQRPPDYNQAKYKEFNLHPITALVPREYATKVGGFDESAPGWEDWTFYLRLAIGGYCGKYYRGPVFVYRVENSIVHHADIAGGQDLMDQVIAPYKNEKGDITMGCCGSTPKTALKAAITSMGDIPMVNGMQTLEYTGSQTGSFIIKHPISKRTYRAGSNPSVRFITVPPEDVAYLLQFSFRIVMPESQLQPPPAPAEVAETIEPQVIEVESATVESIDEKPRRLGRPKKE